MESVFHGVPGKINIIDTHFHIWNLATQRLTWLDTVDSSLNRTFTMDDYEAAYSHFAQKHPVNFLGGIYVDADVTDPLLEDRLLYEISSPKLLATMNCTTISPYMRIPVTATGVRDPLHTDDSPRGRCLEPDFIQGLQILADKNLIFESCNRVAELDDLYIALRQVPQLKVVLNHLGNPGKLTTEYMNSMRNLASLPNLYCKVSGFATAEKSYVQELLDFVTDTFSPRHVMYASNWPVVSLYSSFEEHLEILLDRFGSDEDFFWRNAQRVYGISFAER